MRYPDSAEVWEILGAVEELAAFDPEGRGTIVGMLQVRLISIDHFRPSLLVCFQRVEKRKGRCLWTNRSQPFFTATTNRGCLVTPTMKGNDATVRLCTPRLVQTAQF
jgi:hypothetical protein